MITKKCVRLISLVLILSLTLTACGKVVPSNDNVDNVENESIHDTNSDTNQGDNQTEADSKEPLPESDNPPSESSTVDDYSQDAQDKAEESQRAEEESRQAEEEARKKAEEEKLLAEQKNSFAMMYYLAITAEEIRTSKDNRVELEDIYTSLLNDINPGAIDEITQDHLKNLRDIIKSYLEISIKRDRLQFIYNQEKAAAIRSAVPNPLAVLSISNALDWKKLAMSVVYTAVDSYRNYKNAGESADLEFIMSGWELDDQERETVMKNRDRAFDYMVDMVQEYNLDGLKTLNEKAIERFAEICATENASEKIKLLKAEESTYGLLGNYWLELADCYFEISQYSKCLECVDKYNELSTGIYRQDYNYLQILPKAIVAAKEIHSGDKYISVVGGYADAIITNSSTDDWSSRYFAAQIYLDLYSKTNDESYLRKAYDIASENVTVLLKNQRDLNEIFLNDVVEESVSEPDYRYLSEEEKEKKEEEYKAEQKRVKEYNKALKEARKTELPALYEPLVLNCELLFALSEKMVLSQDEKAEIEAILKTDTCGTFIVLPINDFYSYTEQNNDYSIELTKKEIIIPANLLTSDSVITITVTEKDGGITIIDDCTVDKVKREGSTLDTFRTYISSKLFSKYKWTEDSRVTIEITYNDVYGKKLVLDYAVTEFESHWYGDKVVFGKQ